LAKALKVPVETLGRWLDGNVVPPAGAYLIALDVVAGVYYLGS